MNRRNLLSSLVGGLALALSLGGTTPARAANVTNWILPLNSYIVDTCTGQLVHLIGQCHWIVNSTVDSSGGAHFVYHLNCEGTGTSASGQEYVFHDTANFEVHNPTGCALEATQMIRETLIAKGSGPELVCTFAAHLTINNNCEVTSVRIEPFRCDCKS